MDIKLHYEESGAGEPMILLHGNGEDGSYFKNQIEYFNKSYRVIAVDTRGHGQSPRGTAPFSIEQFGCDLYDFMQELQLKNAIILGFSDGANIAIAFAVKHPDMVKALILNGGNIDPRGVKRSLQILIELEYREARRNAHKSPEAARKADLFAIMVREPHIKPRALSVITAPTLVICGTDDMIKISQTRKIYASLPNAKLVILKGDHFIAAKEPEAFNQAVEEFLESV